jgi:hypothetical protein
MVARFNIGAAQPAAPAAAVLKPIVTRPVVQPLAPKPAVKLPLLQPGERRLVANGDWKEF